MRLPRAPPRPHLRFQRAMPFSTRPAMVPGCQARCVASNPSAPPPPPRPHPCPADFHAQLVSIDLAIHPPSYCIEIDGNLRETEEWRLKKPRVGGAAAALPPTPAQLPAQPSAAPAVPQFPVGDVTIAGADENDDFGDFSEAAELAAEPPAAAAVPASPAPISTPRDPLSAPFGSPQGSPSSVRAAPRGAVSPAEDSFRRFLAAAAPEVASRLEQEDSRDALGEGAAPAGLRHGFGSTTLLAETADGGQNGLQNDDWDDDFGDFEVAAAEMAAGPPAPENGASEDAAPPPPPPPPLPLLRMLVPSSPAKAARSLAAAPPAGASGAVQEYGVAWAMVLAAAAERLEAGRVAWAAAAAVIPPGDADAGAVDVRLQLLDTPRGRTYFAGLGRVFFVAGAVRLAAAELGLLRFMPEMDAAWSRCQAAWGDGGGGSEALGWAAGEAAVQVGLPLAAELRALDAAAVAAPGMSLDDFPRMLAWSEGLDGVTLVPLTAFGEGAVPVPCVDWPPGRVTLAPVANFWLGCVSSVAPELE